MNLAQSLREIASKANVEKHANIKNSYKYQKILKRAKKVASKGEYFIYISWATNELIIDALLEDGFEISKSAWCEDKLVLRW